MEKPRIYFSFRSPYSRLGLHIIARNNIDADYIPFTGPPEGVEFQDPVKNPPKRAYYQLDAPRMTMRMGLPIMRPDPFEVDLTPAIRATVHAGNDGKMQDLAVAISDARWGEGKNISDLQVLEECAEKNGWSPAKVHEAQSDPDVDAALERYRALIEKDQAFGVPFAVFGDSKYWGHERFELLVEDVNRTKNNNPVSG